VTLNESAKSISVESLKGKSISWRIRDPYSGGVVMNHRLVELYDEAPVESEGLGPNLLWQPREALFGGRPAERKELPSRWDSAP
jgi:hypothetical protein